MFNNYSKKQPELLWFKFIFKMALIFQFKLCSQFQSVYVFRCKYISPSTDIFEVLRVERHV